MGYACPVCEAVQADAIHLANHLAITASLGRVDHLAWLDEHAPNWSDCSPEELGAVVCKMAQEVDVPEITDPHEHALRERAPPDIPDGEGRFSPRDHYQVETQAVIEEARKLTHRMYEDETKDLNHGPSAADRIAGKNDETDCDDGIGDDEGLRRGESDGDTKENR